MPYTLGARQSRLYTEVCDLYKPVNSVDSAQTYNLAYSDVRGQFVPTPNIDERAGEARFKQNSIMTSDGMHFHFSQEINDDWVIHIKTGSVREADQWKKVLGASKDAPFHAQAKEFLITEIRPLSAGQVV